LISEITNLDIENLNNAFKPQCIKRLNLTKLANESKFNWIYNSFINSTNEREAARLLSVTGNHSMKWANALSIKNYGTKLSNSEFQIAAKLALGCHQYATTTKLCIVCHEITDRKGHHSTFCKKENSTNKRQRFSINLIL
jgi:hypothetical protein